MRPHRRKPTRLPCPGIFQARTLEWVAISFSNAWKWIVKVKSLSCVRLLGAPWTAAHQAPPSTGFPRQEYWSGVPLPSLHSHSYLNSIHFNYFTVPVPPLSSISHTHTKSVYQLAISHQMLRWLTHTINYRLLFDHSQMPKCCKSSDFDHFQHQFDLSHTKFSNHCWNFSLSLPNTGLTSVIRGTLHVLVQ